jgi:hypothetical protein
MHHQGSDSRSAWAVTSAVSLASMVPSGAPISLRVGACIVTRKELTSCGLPFQFVIPAGSRGRIKAIADDFFTIDIPAAIHHCDQGCIMFDFPDLASMEALTHAS